MSYIHHKALDSLYESFGEKIDLLVEVYMGRYHKQPLGKMKFQLDCNTHTEKLTDYLESQRGVLAGFVNEFEGAPQLQTILEDMMGEIDKCLYICRMHSCAKCKM